MTNTGLPASVDALQEIILQQQTLLETKDRDLEDKQSTIEQQAERLAWLEEWNRLLRSQKYGARSEKIPPEQGRLFNEAELEQLATCNPAVAVRMIRNLAGRVAEGPPRHTR